MPAWPAPSKAWPPGPWCAWSRTSLWETELEGHFYALDPRLGPLLSPKKGLARSCLTLAADSPVGPVNGNTMGKGSRGWVLSWRALGRTSNIPSTTLARSSPTVAAHDLMGKVKDISVENGARGTF